MILNPTMAFQVGDISSIPIIKINEELTESEKRFRNTFEQAAVGIAHVAPDGHFIRINKKFCENDKSEWIAHRFRFFFNRDISGGRLKRQ